MAMMKRSILIKISSLLLLQIAIMIDFTCATPPSIVDIAQTEHYISHHNTKNNAVATTRAAASLGNQFSINEEIGAATPTTQSSTSSRTTSRRELQQQEQQQSLDLYEITEPKLRYKGLELYLDYKLSNMLQPNQVKVTPFSDHDCMINITENNDYMVPELIFTSPSNSSSSIGATTQTLRVHFTIDPVKIQKTPLWKQEGVDQFFITMCVGLLLYTDNYVTNPDNAVAISSLDTLIRVQVDLMGDFGMEFAVDNSGPTEELAEQAYYVEGYICNPLDDNKPFTYMEPKEQGSTIRVCVKPTSDALRDGVYMRSINYFTFFRNEGLPDGEETITQPAIKDGESANEALTSLTCIRGTALCYFDTLLKADFFFSPGRLFGSGEAWLQVRF